MEKQQLLIELKAKGITLTKSQLKQLDGQVKSSRAGMIAMGVGIAAATAALAAMAKTLSHSIRVGKEFEQSMQNLKAISRASASEMLKLESTARKLGASTKFTASQVGGLQTEFAKLGFTVKEIDKVTSATLSLAAATGSDLATSAAVAGQTLRAFGMDASNTHIVTDTMAQSFSRSALDMQKFTDSMSYVAPVAKMAGFEVQGTTAMLGALANAGIDGSMAGTALRRIFLELSNENSKLSKRLGGSVKSIEELIPALEKLKKEGVSTAEMKDLVGLRATSAFNILLEGTDTLDELANSLNNAGGAAEVMANIQLESLEGKMTILNSAWEGLGVAIFDHFEEPLKDATDGLTSFLQSMTSVIETPMSAKLQEQQMNINSLTNALARNLDNEEMRSRLISEMSQNYPEFLDGMDKEKLNAEQLKKRLVEVNDEYKKRILIQIQEENLIEQGDQLKVILDNRADAIINVEDKMVAMSNATGLAIDSDKSYAENIIAQEEHLNNLIKAFDESVQSGETRTKQVEDGSLREGSAFNETNQRRIEYIKLIADQMALVDEAYNANQNLIDLEEDSSKTLAEKNRRQEILNNLLLQYGINLESIGETSGSGGGDDGTEGGSGSGSGSAGTPLVTPAEAEALFAELVEIENGYNENRLLAELEMYDARMELLHNFIDQEYGATEEAEIRKASVTEKYEKKKRQAAFQSFSAGIGMMSSNLNAAAEAGIVSQKTAKKVAVVSAVIKTYESAVNAFNSLAGIPIVGPALGAAAAAAAVASGMAQVEAIKSQGIESPEKANVEKYISSGKAAAKAAEGGLIGGKPHSQGGTMIEAEKGEFIIKKSAVEKIGVNMLNQLNNTKSVSSSSFKYQEGGIVDTGIEPQLPDDVAPLNITFEGNVLSRDFVEEEVIEVLQNYVRRGGEI